MRREGSGIFYTLLSIYAGLISWFYNKSFFWLIIHVLLGPFYVIYELLIGNLADGRWKSIPLSYFN